MRWLLAITILVGQVVPASAADLYAERLDLHQNCYMERNPQSLVRGREVHFSEVAVKICESDNGAPIYAWSYDAPFHTSLGLCAARVTPFIVKRDKAGALYHPVNDPANEWIEPGVALLRTGSATCPPADDGAYIDANGVPDGEFLELLSLWDAIRADPRLLDGLAAGVAARDRSELTRVHRALADPQFPLRVTAIAAERQDREWQSGEPGRRATVIEMVLRDESRGGWYELDFDRGAAGWAIVRVNDVEL
ncbi:MAG TPA: hypothetical protein VGF56_16355 [Rhizomicrobium sp.]|jgi:hypothetical protein